MAKPTEELMRLLDEQIRRAHESMREQMTRRFYGSCSSVMDASSAYCSSIAVYPNPLMVETSNRFRINTDHVNINKIEKVDRKKQLKAEAKAQEMMKEIIGVDQWRIYRQTNLVAVKGKWVWLIGNFYKQYDKTRPFSGKPDVIRIDNKPIGLIGLWTKVFRKGGTPATSFCVQTIDSNSNYPYTDKVISFMVNCAHEEDNFYKMANRIDEFMIHLIPRCALYDGS